MNIDLGKAKYVDTRATTFVNGKVEEVTMWIEFERLSKTYINLNLEEAKQLLADLDKALSCGS